MARIFSRLSDSSALFFLTIHAIGKYYELIAGAKLRSAILQSRNRLNSATIYEDVRQVAYKSQASPDALLLLGILRLPIQQGESLAHIRDQDNGRHVLAFSSLGKPPNR